LSPTDRPYPLRHCSPTRRSSNPSVLLSYPCACQEEEINNQVEKIKIVSPGRKRPPGEVSIIINLYSRTLSILFDGKVYKTYPVTNRKSTRLNSSHVKISYAVFCL